MNYTELSLMEPRHSRRELVIEREVQANVSLIMAFEFLVQISRLSKMILFIRDEKAVCVDNKLTNIIKSRKKGDNCY